MLVSRSASAYDVQHTVWQCLCILLLMQEAWLQRILWRWHQGAPTGAQNLLWKLLRVGPGSKRRVWWPGACACAPQRPHQGAWCAPPLTWKLFEPLAQASIFNTWPLNDGRLDQDPQSWRHPQNAWCVSALAWSRGMAG